MAKSKQPSHTDSDIPNMMDGSEHQAFFEAIPFSASTYTYRDDAPAKTTPPPPVAPTPSDARATAIITLVLIAVTATILALLFGKGLGAIQQSTPAIQDSSSLEL